MNGSVRFTCDLAGAASRASASAVIARTNGVLTSRTGRTSCRRSASPTEIAASFTDIVVTGKVTPPLPTSVQIGMLGQASAEPYEDEYIRIDDVYIVSPNTTGTDGKTHGEFSIGASPGNAILLVGPGAATTFTSKDPTSGQIVTSFKSGQHFSSITGDLTFSFGEWLLKPRSDADLVP